MEKQNISSLHESYLTAPGVTWTHTAKTHLSNLNLTYCNVTYQN
jgi:hypothetical protein